jgi:TonB family protein
MRVLVVDQDSNLLTEISRLLGEYFSIDAVTNKSDALDLLRVNDFEVVVAGERLEDGSGLELLGQLARNRPDMMRIFAADRERLKLLKGRLGPFGLFRTLSYPIELRQLLAALSAAAGIEEEITEEETEVDTGAAAAVTSPAGTPPAPAPAPAIPIASPPAEVTVTAPVRLRPAPPQQHTLAGSGFALAPTARPASSERPSPSNTARPAPAAGASPRRAFAPGARSRAPRQPTEQALAAAHRLDIVARPKGYPPPGEPTPARSAFLVGAGVVLVLGGLFLAFKIFNTPSEPIMTATQAGQHSARFPPEVVKLVGDTETAFQQDDYRTARTDVAALQQIAPDHPRLPFFESLLKRMESRTQEGSRSTMRLFSRHTSAAPSVPVSVPAATEAPRRPGTPVPGGESARSFSGRTIEESPPDVPQTLGTPIAAAADTVEPHLIQRVNPDYPPEAQRRGTEGSVDVSFTVSPEGKVSDVIIVNAEPSDIFDRAAVDAVRRWRYEPRKIGGVAVEAHLQARVQFKLAHGSSGLNH